MPIYLSGRNAGSTITAISDTSFRAYLDSIGALSDAFNADDDIYVALDFDSATAREMSRLSIMPQNAVLLRFEPIVVCPLNYSRKASSSFSRIIDIGRKMGNQDSWEFWPQNWPTRESLQRLDKSRVRIQERLVLINANKLSLISGELYSFRRDLMHSLPVDTFGHHWASKLPVRLKTLLGELKIALSNFLLPQISSIRLWWARHPNIKGPVSDKLKTLEKYQMAVVVENSADYMSEKVFDALFAGCMPIYVGPDPTSFGIPEHLVFRSDSNLASFSAALDRAKTVDPELWIQDLKAFLELDSSQETWAANKVFERLVKHIYLTS